MSHSLARAPADAAQDARRHQPVEPALAGFERCHEVNLARAGFLERQRDGPAGDERAGERAEIGLVSHEHHALAGLQRPETLEEPALRAPGLERRLYLGLRREQLVAQDL